jgi:hypothetical protein
MKPPPNEALAGFAAPPDVCDPSGLVAGYFTDPPGVLLQLSRPTRGTTQLAEWMVGPGFELLAQRFPGHTDLRVILDMRQMTGRSAIARSVLMQRAPSFKGRVGHVVLIPSLHMGAAYIKVVEASALLLRLAGLRVDIEHALERVLIKNGVRFGQSGAARAAPPRGSESRGAPPHAKGELRSPLTAKP